MHSKSNRSCWSFNSANFFGNFLAKFYLKESTVNFLQIMFKSLIDTVVYKYHIFLSNIPLVTKFITFSWIYTFVSQNFVVAYYAIFVIYQVFPFLECMHFEHFTWLRDLTEEWYIVRSKRLIKSLHRDCGSITKVVSDHLFNWLCELQRDSN